MLPIESQIFNRSPNPEKALYLTCKTKTPLQGISAHFRSNGVMLICYKRSIMNKKKNSIFREELPGEKKSIVNLLMTGHIVTISCLGYMAFFLHIQLGQVTRIVDTIDAKSMTIEQVNLLKARVSRSVKQWQNEMVGLAIIGSIVSIIGGIYTINMVIRPLNKLVNFADKEGRTEPLPEFKSNTEIKQLATAITALTTKLEKATSKLEQ